MCPCLSLHSMPGCVRCVVLILHILDVNTIATHALQTCDVFPLMGKRFLVGDKFKQ